MTDKGDTKHPVYEGAVFFQHYGGPCPEDAAAPVLPEYRGAPLLPPPQERITCAPAIRLDWSHDGGADDIVGYWLLKDYALVRPTPPQDREATSK